MSGNKERDRSELGRLIQLARRFASPDWEPMPVLEGDLFELRWWNDALCSAIREILPDSHPLFGKARTANESNETLLDLWRGVEQLPYAVVEKLIGYVHLQHGIWNMDDPGDSEREDL